MVIEPGGRNDATACSAVRLARFKPAEAVGRPVKRMVRHTRGSDSTSDGWMRTPCAHATARIATSWIPAPIT